MSIFPVWISDIKRLEDAFQMISAVGRLTNSESTSFTWAEKIKSNLRFCPYNPNNPEEWLI